MLTFDSLPQARVVRSKGQLMAPPPSPPAPRSEIAQKLYEGLAVAVGLWPLTAVMLLGFGLLILTGMYGSP
ncbi:MAG: hypothetical protein JWP01_1581 [Myxococcales bacterium]|nr:hypothetical protein [Myxococcales bacterium]MDB5556989.1 hypothetical protein [Rhizobium sp.]